MDAAPATTVPYSLFSVYGIELEYMIVDAETLNVRPICDQVIHDVAGEFVSEIERGEISWSNELALHVIELKTNGPASTLHGLADKFQSHVREINQLLKRHHARLLPTAMHPWMNPHAEMKLWPHEYSPVYETFDRIFNCKGHGWANLQSVHINLPFNGDEEFGRLHAAIRLILPLLPAIAASSPVKDGKVTGILDNRLDVYRQNSKKIPSVAGWVIPERAFDQAMYQRLVFDPMFSDIAPLDPEGILRDEFLNARGAIARFGRGSIEIRLLDIQECPRADLAICALVTEVLKLLVGETWTSSKDQRLAVTKDLHRILLECIEFAENGWISNVNYLSHFGLSDTGSRTAGEVWQHLLDEVLKHASPEWATEFQAPLQLILEQGVLARRISFSTPANPQQKDLFNVYLELADCLDEGRMFDV